MNQAQRQSHSGLSSTLLRWRVWCDWLRLILFQKDPDTLSKASMMDRLSNWLHARGAYLSGLQRQRRYSRVQRRLVDGGYLPPWAFQSLGSQERSMSLHEFIDNNFDGHISEAEWRMIEENS